MYGCSYDETATDEALDLIAMLPDGSRYLAALSPLKAWTNSECRLADIVDGLSALTQMLSDKRTTENAPKVKRPWDEYVKRVNRTVQRLKAASIRNRIEKTKWVDVEVNDGEHRQG